MKKDKDGNPQERKTDRIGRKHCCACGLTYVEAKKPKFMRAPCMNDRVANAKWTNGTCKKGNKANPSKMISVGIPDEILHECKKRIVTCYEGYKIPMKDPNSKNVLKEFEYDYDSDKQEYSSLDFEIDAAELKCGQGCVQMSK